MKDDCADCGPTGCKGACPLPLIPGGIYRQPEPAATSGPKRVRLDRQQPHVDRIDVLGSAFLEPAP